MNCTFRSILEDWVSRLLSQRDITTNLKMQWSMTGSKYFGILTCKQTMSFDWPYQWCCKTLKKNVTLLVLLCLVKKELKKQEKADNHSNLGQEVKKIRNLVCLIMLNWANSLMAKSTNRSKILNSFGLLF